MSAGTMNAVTGTDTRTTTSPAARLKALARAELTLLGRSKAALFTALFLPVMLTFSMYGALNDQLKLQGTGLSIGTVLLPAAIGMALLFAVYSNLVGVFVTRREELVLKRLRVGEPTDVEILAGTALPAVLIALAQTVLYVFVGGPYFKVGMPKAPHLMVAGLLIGLVLMVTLAAASAAVTRTTEAAQLTPFPMIMLSLVASGMYVPMEVMPDEVARVLGLLPLSPVIALLRDGWAGGASLGETLKHLVIGLVWIGLGVFAVRRWFRWEPRR
ncbi:ABC transporter permease [Streptomyces sp. NPDC003077]|uniref:ABC transporter permease n=1 Tax=Streptomyces sp. NPDC003077 TaxID=3154443 RepID=UPI0033B3769F